MVCGQKTGNCLRAVGNLPHYFTKCDIFNNIFYVSELVYTRLISFAPNPTPPSSVKGNLLGLISCDIFNNIFYVSELVYTRLISFAPNPTPASSVKGNLLGLISQSLHY